MAKTTGVDFVIYVNTGTEEVPVWSKVGGQRGATLSRSKEGVDSTDKDSTCRERLCGIRDWSIDFDGLIIETDTGYLGLEAAYESDAALLVQARTPAGHIHQGSAILTDFSIEGPYDAEATYSGTLEAAGTLTKT